MRSTHTLLCAAAAAVLSYAQPVPGGRGPQGPQVVSPEVQPDGRVTFRILAPKAQAVRLNGSDIPGNQQGAGMIKAVDGVWSATLGPIEPGSYRYNFNLDGVPVIDPRNPSISESNNNVWSMFHVAGGEFMDTRDVPRGAVAAVTYYSKALQKFRRMHVYTPPGYESGQGKYPVFYLLHGAGDADASWSSVGRAGFILDNLSAARKAKPMVVVMPAGHTRQVNTVALAGAPDDFLDEFLTDIMPYAESHYRVYADRARRAIAGLSMGGNQTLNLAIPHLDKFAYVGVYSSGLIGGLGAGRGGAPAVEPVGAAWEQSNMAALDNPALKKGLKLVWFSTGKDDFLIDTTRASVALLRKHGFEVTYEESAGGHTWINWRNYLNAFAPLLF